MIVGNLDRRVINFDGIEETYREATDGSPGIKWDMGCIIKSLMRGITNADSSKMPDFDNRIMASKIGHLVRKSETNSITLTTDEFKLLRDTGKELCPVMLLGLFMEEMDLAEKMSNQESPDA